MSEKKSSKAPEIERPTKRIKVRLGDLNVDHRYQGQLHRRRVANLLNEWNDKLGMELFISIRSDGSMWILDGQHRHAVLMEFGLADCPLEVNAYEGLSVVQEARIHKQLNNTRKRTAYENFQDDVVGKVPPAPEINNLVEECGWKVSQTEGQARVCSIASLRLIFSMLGAEALRFALSVIAQAWRYRALSADGPILLGLASAFRGDKTLASDKLVSKLQQFTPTELAQNIRFTNRQRRIPMAAAGEEIIVNLLRARVRR